MKEFLQKLRRFEIRIRKAVNTRLEGNFSSVFKGSGLEFDDIRDYQYGDDIRYIDWNVSAKGHGVFVKTFREEKEQTIFFMLDVSASQQIGRVGASKLDLAKEVCGVLTLSAIKEGSQVGLYCFSDQKEKYIKPGKGLKVAYLIVSALYRLAPVSRGTALNQSVLQVLNILKRRSVVILISDFIDQHWEHTLQALARLHDLVVIQVYDSREKQFPKLGIIPLFDAEQGRTVWMNTSFGQFSRSYAEQFARIRENLEAFCRKNQVDYLALDTQADFVPELVRLFKVRNKSRKIG